MWLQEITRGWESYGGRQGWWWRGCWLWVRWWTHQSTDWASSWSKQPVLMSVSFLTDAVKHESSWNMSHHSDYWQTLVQGKLLTCFVLRPTQPSWDRIWVVVWATGWRPNVVDWDDGMSMGCTERAVYGHVMRGVISSCQSATTSEIVKHHWSRLWLV